MYQRMLIQSHAKLLLGLEADADLVRIGDPSGEPPASLMSLMSAILTGADMYNILVAKVR